MSLIKECLKRQKTKFLPQTPHNFTLVGIILIFVIIGFLFLLLTTIGQSWIHKLKQPITSTSSELAKKTLAADSHLINQTIAELKKNNITIAYKLLSQKI